MIDTYIISGFLGAGKTTFIQRLLKMNLGKVMLLENEFGEVGVDSSFFDKSLSIKEVNNGCICCSMKGDFDEALKEIESYNIDTLIIEPSGVGKLSDIMAILLNNDHYRLLSHACVVNAETCKKYHLNYKEFFDDQVIASNAIVLSHLDVASEEKVNEAHKILENLNDEAMITEKPFDDYSNEELLDIIVKNVCVCPECLKMDDHHHHDEECECGCHHHDHNHKHHHHDGDEVFDSFAIKTNRIFKKEELEAIFNDLDESVLRVKGYVKGESTMWYFNYILNEYHIYEGEIKDEALVVVIGTKLDEKLKELFR